MEGAEAPDTFACYLKSLATHFDEDGDPVSTLVVISEGGEATTRENKLNTDNLSNNQHAVRQAIRTHRKDGDSASYQVVRYDLKSLRLRLKTITAGSQHWLTTGISVGMVNCYLCLIITHKK